MFPYLENIREEVAYVPFAFFDGEGLPTFKKKNKNKPKKPLSFLKIGDFVCFLKNER